MDQIADKWKRLAKELFELFSRTMAECGYSVKEVIHPIFHPKNLQEMFKMGVTHGDIRDMVVFSVKNWDKLKTLSSMRSLAHEPCFNQMLSQWKYPTLIYISKAGFEAVNQPSLNPTAPQPEVEDLFDKWAKKP